MKIEILEKIFKCTYENLNGKLMFYQFFIESSSKFVIYTALENSTIFLQQFFLFRRRDLPPSLQAPLINNIAGVSGEDPPKMSECIFGWKTILLSSKAKIEKVFNIQV